MSESLDFNVLAHDLSLAVTQRYDVHFLGSPLDVPRPDPIGYSVTAKDFAELISWVEFEALANTNTNPQVRFADSNKGSLLLDAPRYYELSRPSYDKLLAHVMSAFVRTHRQ